ncbi:MAG: YjbQ family protein [Caldithrix sp.]|nr:YjbQ family protein [Caldithrix sp.]
MEQLTVPTNNRTQMVDITREVQQSVKNANVNNGSVIVFVPHTTAAVTINENADPSVQRDILYELNKVIPFDDSYQHMEGNSAAHIKASLLGSSQTVIVKNGSLQLGTWQGIYFCEFDGPRKRKAWIQIIQNA